MIYVLSQDIERAAYMAKRSKRRMSHLRNRVAWFSDKFKEIEKSRVFKPQDLKVLVNFKQLLEEIAMFSKSIDADGWMNRLWKATTYEDAIDEFNARLEETRNDLIFIFTTDTPLPRAWDKGDEQDVAELLETVKAMDAKVVETELKHAKLTKDDLLKHLERKFRESVSRSENFNWTETLSKSVGSTLHSEDFRPSLQRLSKERYPSLVIGEGSFGIVFKCQWRGDLVAVKVLKMQTLSERAVAQLGEEMRIMVSLGVNRNVVSVYGLLSDPLCLVMGYAAKGSLRQLLDQPAYGIFQESSVIDDRHEFRTKWRWAYEIANGMAWLHSATPPIIHRDLKSDNILVDEDGRLLVTDFGCAIAKSETLSSLAGAAVNASVAGSVPWMPPEAFSLGKQSADGDVYAYGIVLWEILTFDIPWTGIHPALVPSLVQGGQRPSLPSAARLDIPGAHEFVKLVRECWDHDPGKRPPFAHVKPRTLSQILRIQKAQRPPITPGFLKTYPDDTMASVAGNIEQPAACVTDASFNFSKGDRGSIAAPSFDMPIFSSKLRDDIHGAESSTPMGLRLRVTESDGISLGSSILSSPPAILPFSMTPGVVQTPSAFRAPAKTPRHGLSVARTPATFPEPPSLLNSCGIVGLCEWLVKAGGGLATEITVKSYPMQSSRSLLKGVLELGEQPSGERLLEMINAMNATRLERIYIVAGAVKEHFKGLREPVTTFALYETVVQIGIAQCDSDDVLARDVGDVLTRVAEPSYSCLRALLQFLNQIKSVPLDRLAFEWSQLLFRPETVPSASDSVTHTKVLMRVCRICILNVDAMFDASSKASAVSTHAPVTSTSRLNASRSQRRLLFQKSSSSASSFSTSGSFRKRLTRPFANGLQGFVRVFPPSSSSTSTGSSSVTFPSVVSSSSMLSAKTQETAYEAVDEANAIVGVDPVSKARLSEDEVYARDGDIYFQSVATQNFYYKMLEAGYQFENGNFVEAKRTETTWALRTIKGDFALIGGSSKNRKLDLNLVLQRNGKHMLIIQVEEYKDSRTFFTKSKGVKVAVELLAGDQMVGERMTFQLSPQADPSIRFPFHIPPCKGSVRPAYRVRIAFESLNRTRRFIIRSRMERACTPLHRVEIEHARTVSTAQLQPDDDEFLVEFEKDAFGLGLSVVWSGESEEVVVKAVEAGGAASRSARILKGDIIRAVQGVRVKGLDYREVAKMLRNIPLVAVLVVARPAALA